ncbi:MAG: hypothetical protein E6G56_01415 [Actinobacteria bacterium]|nr:MAG: hypothetical protein E6G56_01415 [Actinomycetota bacterium]
MEVAVALFIAVVAVFLLIVIAGLTAFIAVPVGIIIVAIPFAIGGLGAARAASSDEDQGLDPQAREQADAGVPSTREAAYEPVSAPEEAQARR